MVGLAGGQGNGVAIDKKYFVAVGEVGKYFALGK
jgi:hypothetical protein